MTVTPRDIDRQVRDLGKVLGYAVNWALQDLDLEEMDALYPQYQFARHKGYGTKLHVELLRQYGPCPIHRRSFLKKLLPPEVLSDGR